MKRIFCLIIVLLSLSCSKGTEPVIVEFRLAQLQPEEGLLEKPFERTGETFYLHEEVLIGNADIAAADALLWQGRHVIDLTFTEPGKEKLARLTRDHLQERVGMLVDGRLVSAPIINAPILEGRALIEGDFTEEEARRIAKGIMSGLPRRSSENRTTS
jgi:preprotein translocase subunit SecD